MFRNEVVLHRRANVYVTGIGQRNVLGLPLRGQ